MHNGNFPWRLTIVICLAGPPLTAGTLEPVISGKAAAKLDAKSRIGVGNQNCTYSGQKNVFFTAAHCLRRPEESVMLHLVGGEIVKLKCLRSPLYNGGPANDVGVCAVDKTYGDDTVALVAADTYAAPPAKAKDETNCLSNETPKANDPLVLAGCAAPVDEKHKPKGKPAPEYCAEGKSVVGRYQSNVILTPWDFAGNNLAKGDSGGPAKNKDGRIVGINSMIEIGEKNVFTSVAYNKPFIDEAAKKLGVDVCWKGEAKQPDAPTPAPPIAENTPAPQAPAPPGGQSPGLGLKLELNLKFTIQLSGPGGRGSPVAALDLGFPHAALPERVAYRFHLLNETH